MNVGPATRRTLVGALVLVASLLPAMATARQYPGLGPTNHVWGRFRPGAWKRIRIVTQTYGPDGRLTATTNTHQRIELVKVDAETYTTEIEASIEVAGRTLDAPVQIDTRPYYALTSELVDLGDWKTAGSGKVDVEEHEIRCDLYTAEVADDGLRRTARVYVSDMLAPHVLRIETSTVSLDSMTELATSLYEVLSVELPYRLLGENRVAALAREIRRSSKGARITVQFLDLGVPGGIVAEHSKELDQEGRLIRHNTLEVIDYAAP